MKNTTSWNEASFSSVVESNIERSNLDFSKTLNIAVVGKVSTGKSSLINALLMLSRREALEVAKVGAISGVTRQLKVLKLDDKVSLIDSPGLDDVRQENSEVTNQFLKYIDVGIFVITGSSDISQKKILDDLKKHCNVIFIVLNKIDQWDGLDPKVLDNIMNQWSSDLSLSTLGVNKIYPTCVNGYDPKSLTPKMDIRGVSDLRNDIFGFLEKEGKDLLLKRHVAEKQSHAIKIISSALVVVAGQVFIPVASLPLIASTQATAIVSLYYLYTGKVLSPKAVIALLPCFATQSVLPNAFLFIQSFLPPTGIFDAAAAMTVVVITLAMLCTVNSMLANGTTLEETEQLQMLFRKYKNKVSRDLHNTEIKKMGDQSFWNNILKKFVSDQSIY